MQMMRMNQQQAATKIQSSFRGRSARNAMRKPRPADPKAGLAWAIKEAVTEDKIAKGEPIPTAVVVDRERLCCDILNTSVMGALVGGFALGNLQAPASPMMIEKVIYFMSCFAVHACTCSCLTSALLYHVVVRMHDDLIEEWARTHKMLLAMPLMKFVMGCIPYLGSVILMSWRDLEGDDVEASVFRIACLVVGVMSMSTVLMTMGVIAIDSVKDAQKVKKEKKKRREKPRRVAPN